MSQDAETQCLTCLNESTTMFNLSMKCEFRLEENVCDGQNVVGLDVLYTEFTNLPLPDASQKNVTGVTDICSSCLQTMKEFHLFRVRARKSYEELQTKMRISQIISHLDNSSVGSVCPERLQEDFGVGNDPLRCDTCLKRFQTRKRLLRHQEIHLTEARYKCKYCGKAFTSRANHYNHELTVHRKRPVAGNAPVTEQDGFLCEICALSFKTKRKLKYHESAAHRPRKRITCDLCGKAFTRNSSLKEHKTLVHEGVRSYSCEICGKLFGKENSLKMHVALHVGKSHWCGQCGKGFVKPSLLKRHMQEHGPMEPARFPCTVCLKLFKTKAHLTEHEVIHRNERPFECTVCNSSFRQKRQLKVHGYLHYGKPFKCEHCATGFTSRSRWLDHTEGHRDQTQSPKATSKGDPTDDTKTASAEPDFGDNVINEEILNEICYQIDSNQIILQNIEDDEQIVFFDEEGTAEVDQIEFYEFGKDDFIETATAGTGSRETGDCDSSVPLEKNK